MGVIVRQVHVPAGAGLGGGSANAATTLWAANELCGRPATNEQLLDWSGAIGSDISVFFSRGAAYCTGRHATHCKQG
jgi:4-diphosphocytidyl-2-C-methyl-D-erythritol kinase